MLAAFRKGLSETGFVEGRNLAIEFTWYSRDRRSEVAADLVRRKVDVIAAPGNSLGALAAKALIRQARPGRDPQSARRQCDRLHRHE
jgi:hypothetical protein